MSKLLWKRESPRWEGQISVPLCPESYHDSEGLCLGKGSVESFSCHSGWRGQGRALQVRVSARQALGRNLRGIWAEIRNISVQCVCVWGGSSNWKVASRRL